MSVLEENLIEGEYKRVSVTNFSKYLDKLGVSEAKKKIALKATSFHNIISLHTGLFYKIENKIENFF